MFNLFQRWTLIEMTLNCQLVSLLFWKIYRIMEAEFLKFVIPNVSSTPPIKCSREFHFYWIIVRLSMLVICTNSCCCCLLQNKDALSLASGLSGGEMRFASLQMCGRQGQPRLMDSSWRFKQKRPKQPASNCE